jgi:hypothetical protein
MSRTAEEITQAHNACLDGAETITSVIATHNKGDNATIDDYGNDMTEDEKKARVTRSVGYLKHQKTLDDWGSEDFTVIDAAISAADTFTG